MAARKKTETVEQAVESVEVTEQVVEAETAATDEAAPQVVENTFSKAKLVGSKRFANRRDILNVKLKNDKQYTISEVEAIIAEFEKGGK